MSKNIVQKLIATEILFRKHSIVYKVESALEDFSGFISSPSNIKDKDLFLKCNFFDSELNEVVYAPVNTTTEFYERIYNKTISNYEEYFIEAKQIYKVGDVVGLVFTKKAKTQPILNG